MNEGDGLKPEDFYQLIMEETKWPMIEAIMEFTGNNQGRPSRILGLNRRTFRKNLEQFNTLNNEEINSVINLQLHYQCQTKLSWASIG